jgi:hypothetical protein
MHAVPMLAACSEVCCVLLAAVGAVLNDNLEVVAEKANEAVKTVSQPQVRASFRKCFCRFSGPGVLAGRQVDVLQTACRA